MYIFMRDGTWAYAIIFGELLPNIRETQYLPNYAL
jgi:hypothetical protein